MREKDIEKLAVGNICYKQSKDNCKSCYRVKVVEILNDREVMVQGLTKNKKGKLSKPFKTFIATLHTSSGRAIGGYKKHHK